MNELPEALVWALLYQLWPLQRPLQDGLFCSSLFLSADPLGPRPGQGLKKYWPRGLAPLQNLPLADVWGSWAGSSDTGEEKRGLEKASPWS